MYKKIMVLAMFSTLASCGEKDLAYYQSNIDAAEAKHNECEAGLKAAIKEKNKDKLKLFATDAECKMAWKAYKNYKSTEKRAATAKKQNEIKAKIKAEESAYQVTYDQAVTRYSALTIDEFFKTKEALGCDDAKTMFSVNCKAYSSLIESRKELKVADLANTYTKEVLEAKNEKECVGDLNFTDKCKLYDKAITVKNIQISDYYKDNPDMLKRDFNDCRDKALAADPTMQSPEYYAITRSSKCSTIAGHAASTFQVYMWDNSIN